MEARAMKELDYEFKVRERKLDRDSAQASEMGLGEEAGEPSDMGPTPADMLAQALSQQAQALQSGLMDLGDGLRMLAQAQAAPKRVVRGPDGRVAGVEAV
jgi:hypothetical protein